MPDRPTPLRLRCACGAHTQKARDLTRAIFIALCMAALASAVQAPGAMLFETRRVGTGKPQALWFANLESAGWTQWFVGARGSLREFRAQSTPGAWPLVMGAEIVTQDGQKTLFRMTISRASDDDTRRLLESTRDAGRTWTTVFDYRYRRAKD